MAGRKVIRYLLLVLVISHSGFTLAANTNHLTVSFSDAWLTAQDNSDFLASKQAGVERAQLKQDALRGLSFPRVDLIGSYTHINDTIELDILDFNPFADLQDSPLGEALIGALGGPGAFRTDFVNQNYGRVALGAVWPVYTGGRVTAAREAGAAQTDVARQQKDVQRRTLFEELVRAYFGVSLAQENLKIHQQTEHDLGLHLDNAVNWKRKGKSQRFKGSRWLPYMSVQRLQGKEPNESSKSLISHWQNSCCMIPLLPHPITCLLMSHYPLKNHS